MKTYHLIPLMFLSACSTTPKLTLRPQSPPPATDNSAVRYPEVVRAYHFGRYVDPNDDLVMHEQHVVYRVEENTRWDLRSLRTATIGCAADSSATLSAPHDAAFSPLLVNDAVRAEVNAQSWRPFKSCWKPEPCRRRWRSFRPRCSRPKPICRKQRCCARQ